MITTPRCKRQVGLQGFSRASCTCSHLLQAWITDARRVLPSSAARRPSVTAGSLSAASSQLADLLLRAPLDTRTASAASAPSWPPAATLLVKHLCPSLALGLAAESAASLHLLGLPCSLDVLALVAGATALVCHAGSARQHPAAKEANDSLAAVALGAAARVAVTVALPVLACAALGHAVGAGAAALTAPPLPLPVLAGFAFLNASCVAAVEELRAGAVAASGSLVARVGVAESKCLLALACLANAGACAASGHLQLAVVPLVIAAAAAATGARGGAAAAQQQPQPDPPAFTEATHDLAMATSLLTFGAAWAVSP